MMTRQRKRCQNGNTILAITALTLLLSVIGLPGTPKERQEVREKPVTHQELAALYAKKKEKYFFTPYRVISIIIASAATGFVGSTIDITIGVILGFCLSIVITDDIPLALLSIGLGGVGAWAQGIKVILGPTLIEMMRTELQDAGPMAWAGLTISAFGTAGWLATWVPTLLSTLLVLPRLF